MCVCVCVCLCVCMCTFRVGQNLPEGSPVAGTILVDSQQPILQEDHTYASVDDAQQQMFALSSNPAYKNIPEHSQQPLQEDDQVYYNIDISQLGEVVTSGNPKHGTALEAAASAK